MTAPRPSALVSAAAPVRSRRTLLREGLALAALLQTVLAELGSAAHAASAAPALSASDWDAAFDAHRLEAALRALKLQPVEDPVAVSLKVQDLAENGAAVPVAIGTNWAPARWLLLLVAGNPSVLSAAFEIQPERIEPQFSLRVKMAGSSPVLALALDGSGQARYARHEVTVIQGSCTA